MLNSAITTNNLLEKRPVAQSLVARRLKNDSKRSELSRANRLAWLVVDGQTQGFHCQLREFSTDGAQLTVSGLMGIPDQFLLFIEPDSVRFTCKVMLRKGNSVKVSFIEREENVRYRDFVSCR